MNREAIVLPAVAPVHKEPVFSSEMISQALMWENVTIQETYKNWYQIRMEDGYLGWIHSFYLNYHNPRYEEHIFVTDRYAPVFYEKDKQNSIAALLSYGTYVPVVNIEGGYCKIYLPDGSTGFIKLQKQIDKSGI